MENKKLAQAGSIDPNVPATLTDEQAAKVAGGLPLVGLGGVDTHMCCLTCASFGRPLFSAVAKAMAT